LAKQGVLDARRQKYQCEKYNPSSAVCEHLSEHRLCLY